MDRHPKTVRPILSRRSPAFRRSIYVSILRTRNAGRRLVIACETTFRFSPQLRQNFVSSLFWNPHFGQYIQQTPTEPLVGDVTRVRTSGVQARNGNTGTTGSRRLRQGCYLCETARSCALNTHPLY